MARNDILVKLRLAGEEFAREFDSKFDEAIKGAEAKSESSGQRAGGGFAKGFLGAAGIGAIGTAIGVAISESAELGAEIASTSRQFNIGAEELQVWRFAAQQAGVTAGEFDGSLNDLTQRIGEANAGNRAAQQSFVDLGLSFQTTSGQARTTDSVMLDLADRIASIEDPSERVRLGTQLLGSEFETLYPLLLDGATGFDAAAAELDKFGGVLSREEIQNLQQTNAKIEQMKSVLSIKIAGVVAENADAILNLTNELLELAGASVTAANNYLTFKQAVSATQSGVAALPPGLSGPEKRVAEDLIAFNNGLERRQTNLVGGFFGALAGPWQRRSVQASGADERWQGPGDFLSNYLGRGAPPKVSGAGVASRASPVRRTSSGAARASAVDREAERTAQAAIRNEERMREQIERTTLAQEDSAEVERIRAEQGEVAAATEEARLDFLRQNPLLVYDQVDALGVALGYTKDLTEADKERLQLLIDQGNAAEKLVVDRARAEAKDEFKEEARRQQDENKRITKAQADQFRREYDIAIQDVADLYEIAMRRGTDGIFDHFKDEGLRIIAEIAAQWSLAMIAGNSFDLGSAASGAFARSPISSIFFGSGGPGFAANDNGGGLAGLFGGGGESRIVSGDLPTGGDLGGVGAGTTVDATLGGGASLLSTASTALGIAGLGLSLASPLLGLLGGTKRGSVNIGDAGGSLGITGSRGNSSSREQAASASAGSLIDAIYQIADQLGADVNAGAGRVSIGVRKDNFRVDTSGSGITKTKNGAIDFGSDEQAAIEFAIRDLISDGVLTGLSQASQNLLNRPGTDLETQIEKALLIEQVPNLLKQRLDPLGAALDEVYDKFKLLADALKEGGASAEQVAEAQRLYELEKAEAIASIGAASQTLKDFLDSLNAGSNSPLSLRQQRGEAEAQLAPFLEQIASAEAARAEVDRLKAGGAGADQITAAETAARTAAAAIDQSGFTDASQLLLSISRQSNASTGTFFSDFDRIRALTGQAIGFVDASTPSGSDSRDPFSSAIAKNTEDAAYILTDQTAIMQRQGETLQRIETLLSRGGGGGFIGETRAFAR